MTAYDYPVSSPYNGGAGESLPYAEEFAQQAYTSPAPYTPSFTASEPVAYSPSVVSHKEADTAQTQTAAQGQPKSSGIIVGTKSLDAIRADFPILQEKINGYDLVWFDNGATTQRPIQVIDRLSYYYKHENSNVHRGAHALAARSTDAYENARQITADFLGDSTETGSQILWHFFR